MSDFLNGLPYTNFHELNASWFMDTVKRIAAEYDSVVANVAAQDAKIAELSDYVYTVMRDRFPAEVASAMEKYAANGDLERWVSEYINAKREFKASVSDGTQDAIIRVVNSYIKNNDKLMYMHTMHDGYTEGPAEMPNGTWLSHGYNWLDITHQGTDNKGCDTAGNRFPSSDSSSDEREGYAINCSAFVQLVLMGIPYEASRYATNFMDANGGSFTGVGAAGYCVDLFNGDYNNQETIDNYRLADQIYDAFLTMGQAEATNDRFTNLAPGDIVFHDDGDGNIDHCGVVLAKTGRQYDITDDQNGLYLIADAGNQGYPIRACLWYSAGISGGAYNIHYWTHVAHPMYDAVPMSAAKTYGVVQYANAHIDIKGEYFAGQIVTVDFDYNGSNNVRLRPDNQALPLPGYVLSYVNKNGHVRAITPLLVPSAKDSERFNPLFPPDSIALEFTTGEVSNIMITDGLGPAAPVEVTVSTYTNDDSVLWDDLITAMQPLQAVDLGKREFPIVIRNVHGYSVQGTALSGDELTGTLSMYKGGSSASASVYYVGQFNNAAGRILFYGARNYASPVVQTIKTAYWDFANGFQIVTT